MTPDPRRIAHAALSLTEPPFLKHYRRGRFRVWDGVAMTGSELPGPGFNFAACLTATPPLADVVAVAADFFADADQGWGVLVEGDAGHPVEAELRAAGWAVAEDEPAFVLPALSGSPPFPGEGPGEGWGLHLTPQPPSLGGKGEPIHIRPVRTAADMATFIGLAAAAYGTTPEFAALIMPSLALAHDPDMLWLIAEADGVPVGMGGYFRSGATAVVAGLATLEAHRGRGIGASVVRVALADAAAKGCTHAALRSGPKSVPLYERLGFRYVCQHRTYAAPGPPA